MNFSKTRGSPVSILVLHLSMLSPKEGGGGGEVGHGVGILTFSEKMSQIPHTRDNIIGQKYQKPHSGASEGGQNNTLQTLLHTIRVQYMYHSPFVQPPLTKVGSSFERLLGIFQDGGVIFKQPCSPGLSPRYLGRKTLGNKIDFQALFIIQDGGHVKFLTLGICRTIKIPTLGTDLTVKAPRVARLPSPPTWGLTLIGALGYASKQCFTAFDLHTPLARSQFAFVAA